MRNTFLIIFLLLGAPAFLNAHQTPDSPYFSEAKNDKNTTFIPSPFDMEKWTGNTDKFYPGFTAQGHAVFTLDDSASGSAFLSIPCEFPPHVEWRFRVQLNGREPDKQSQMRVYVASDRADLSQPLHGYFLAVGVCNEALTGDPTGQYIAFYRQDGGAADTTLLFDCHSEMFLTAYSMLQFYLSRDIHGEWRLYTRLADNEPRFWGSAVDPSDIPSGYFGFHCTYSKADAQNYTIGDFALQAMPDQPQLDFRLEAESFTPNGDGVQDEARIAYRLPAEGYTLRLSVYDASGRCVRSCPDFHPERTVTEAPDSSFFWDGRNDSDELQPIGIYILYIEASHPEHGTSQKKIPVALSR